MNITLPITSNFKDWNKPFKATFEEFLEIKKQYPEYRFEYDDGYIIPMTGGTNNHSLLMSAINALCWKHLLKDDCKAFVEPTLKVGNSQYSPDVAIDCNKTRPRNYIEYPVIVVEVLSASTKKYDKRRKLEVYKSIESIKEIFYVEQASKDILVYRRCSENPNKWNVVEYFENDIVEFHSINFSVSIDDIYANVVFD